MNQRAPSGPGAIPYVPRILVGSTNKVTTPSVVIRPIDLPAVVNQIAPSGPVAIPTGELVLEAGKLVTEPVTVIRPIDPVPFRNHSAPSGT